MKKTNIKKQIDDLRSAIQANDADRIKQLSDELQKSVYAVSSRAYESAGASASAPSGDGSAPKPDDDVIDAEFRPTDEGVGASK